jgi:methionyl-tRNA formyltransferase
MKYAVIGCVQFSAAMFEHLLKQPGMQPVAVVTRQAASHNGDFRSLAPLAGAADCAVHFDDNNDQRAIHGFLMTRHPDVIFCLGWGRLLNPQILTLAPHGVIGYHPAALPQNRGRHPLIWALALGLRQTGSTFFILDEGADSGDIVAQQLVAIEEQDDAASLYKKITDLAAKQLTVLCQQLTNNRLERRPQAHDTANYWRKRGKADGLLDWRMSSHSLHNLIRALGRPYPGAHCAVNGNEVKIWRAAIGDACATNLEPGKVLTHKNGQIQVKTGDGSLWLVEHEFVRLPLIGSYLL